ncbi:UDP-N-acetylmuramoyl-L-alanine--D-glutamate ligase [Saccharopolyspora endophytica]|uniref:UDP-N-acetylmuramoylalanine--D-glutamate ligase n=1 Tax=Saccharopolyspora endophytica TaxID=543886 RepID=A0ABS5DF76_9PSEU|nr:UDP-N-acetylmuramoyl-L-alanine--D-glutamate ligase [Saccharopolyspora endophytica]MBQ0924802.1 UDP-N-acetylmuramoyl-L-alanine--D-glutamate ligase [Saccharopolyspora endophytica]
MADSRYRGLRVLVAGAGVSGRSAAEALLAAGAEVTVTDGSADRLAALASLESQGAQLVPGLSTPPEDTDLVVTSPGWRPDAPLPAAAAAGGIEVIGEVELAWWLDQERPEGPATWLAVTGTNGKTTTVSMLESILRAAGADVVACGNVGLPVVDAVRAGHRVLAVELSSFQLHWQRALRPKAGAVLNLADDHLDWHGSLESYGEAKAKVFAGNDVAVFNADDEWSTRLVEAAGDRRVSFTLGVPQAGQLGVDEDRLVDRAFGEDVELALLSEVRPAGPHNVANALAAAALARAHGVEPAAVAAGLRDFEPGAHRSVLIAEADDVSYVDDSKATNPHAADAALRAHDSVVWIAGGLLKGADVDELVRANAGRLATAVLIGRDRGEFSAALGRHAPDVPVHEVASGDDAGMLEAVRLAHDSARPGSVVLLAPAAASMDMFTDYAHRGRAFADAVRDVLSETPAATTRGG